MENIVLVSIAAVIVAGIISQWLAWRIQWPSIVIMSIAGLLLGPVLGLLGPQEALGNLYSPFISLAVAIILFEGSSSLDIREIKGVSKSVFRIVTAGAFFAWIGGALAAHYIAGLSLEISFIIGGLFIVTGPTVILPLLRNAKLKPRTAAVLKWEGIIVDPFGPLLALFAYEIIKVLTTESLHVNDILHFFLSALAAIILGYFIGVLVSFMISKGAIPEYLKSPVIIAFVLLCFTLAEIVMHEIGMLAVTVLGLTLARTKQYIPSIGKNISHFVENVSVLLTSTIFILLTASLTRETIADMFTWPIIGFVLVMLFIVRPLSIWLSTIGTELSNAEKMLIGWIAPRGIVALSVSGYFATILLHDGHEDAAMLTALTFALVFITVCAHGFSLRPIAKALNLANTDAPGVLLVGANSFSIALADYLQKIKIPVLISDASAAHLQRAVSKKIPVYQGQILSEHSEYEIDMTPYETILSLTGDVAFNVLVSQSYAPKFGHHHTFTLSSSSYQREDTKQIPFTGKAHLLFDERAVYTALNKRINTGHTIQTLPLHQKGKLEKDALPEETIPLFIQKKNRIIQFVTLKSTITLDEGDQLVVLRKEKA